MTAGCQSVHMQVVAMWPRMARTPKANPCMGLLLLLVAGLVKEIQGKPLAIGPRHVFFPARTRRWSLFPDITVFNSMRGAEIPGA